MGMYSTINGKQLNILASSFSLEDTAENFNSCSFSFISPIHQFLDVQKGMQVEVFKDDHKLFSGYIYNSNKEIGMGKITYSVEAQGNDYIAKKRLVCKAFYNLTAEYIVKWITSYILALDGITWGNIKCPEKLICSFDYVSAYDALDHIAEETNSLWYIDQYKKLHFFEKYSEDMIKKELYLKSVDVIGGDIQLDDTQYKYRNRQHLRNCKGRVKKEAYFTVEEGKKLSALNVGYPILSKPYVGFITESGGIEEQQVDKKGNEEKSTALFFWEKDSESISVVERKSETTETLLDGELEGDIDGGIGGAEDTGGIPAGTQIYVLFYGSYDLNITVEDKTEVNKQRKIDGTTGVYEVADTCSYVGYELCLEYGQKLLESNKQKGLELVFLCKYEKGLEYSPGAVIPITLLEAGLKAEHFLITSRTLVYIGTALYFQIKCIRGQLVENWIAFFDRMANYGGQNSSNLAAGGGINTVAPIPEPTPDGDRNPSGWETEEKPLKTPEEVVEENAGKTDTDENGSEVLPDNVSAITILYEFEKTFLEEDNPNLFGEMLFPSFTLYPSEHLFPCDSKTSVLSWLDFGKTKRVEITANEKSSDGNTIFSTFYIPADVAGNITELRFYDGNAGANEKTGGRLVHKVDVNFNKVKYLEVYQITLISKKGW